MNNRIYDYFGKDFIDNRIKCLSNNLKYDNVPFPYRVEIQPTSYCNRICKFCSHAARNSNHSELNESEVFNVLDTLNKMGCNNISFSGGGEPFEWRKGNLINLINDYSSVMKITVTTNGDVYWNKDRFESKNLQLLKKCTAVIINVPEVTVDGFKRIATTNIDWGEEKKKLQNIVAYKKKYMLDCQICAVVVVSKLNIHDLVLIDKFLYELDVDKIYYKNLKNYEDGRLDDIALDDNDLLLLSSYLNFNCSKSLVNFIKNLASKKVDCIMSEPVDCWANQIALSCIIDPNGEVYVCTPYVGNEKYSIGNIKKDSFDNIWNSKIHMRVIAELNENAINDICPEECRFHAYNRILDSYLNNNCNTESVYVNAGMDDNIQ